MVPEVPEVALELPSVLPLEPELLSLEALYRCRETLPEEGVGRWAGWDSS